MADCFKLVKNTLILKQSLLWQSVLLLKRLWLYEVKFDKILL